jgi:signal transduction histidine kinase/ActR/RegA family two-component response regulator
MGGEPIAGARGWFPTAAGGCVALVGAVALISWPLDIPALRGEFPGFAPVEPGNAICFLCAGLALALLAPRPTPPRRRVLGLAFAWLAAAWGGTHLVELVSATAFQSPGTIFPALASRTGLPFEGENTIWRVLMVGMLGGAPLLLNTRRAHWVGELLVVVPLSVSFLGILVEVFRYTGVGGRLSEMPSGLPTLVGFLLLEVGLLLARPERGWMGLLTSRTLGGSLARRLLPVAVLLPFGTMWLCALAQKAGILRADYIGGIVSLAIIFVESVLIMWYAAVVNRADRGRKEAEEFVRTLLRVAARLNSTLDLDELLAILAAEAADLTGAETGGAGLRTPAGMEGRRYVRDGRPGPFDRRWPPGEGLAGRVAENGTPYLTNDAGSDTVIDPGFRAEFGVRSALTVPILDSRGEVLGFVEAHNHRAGGFTPGDRDRLVAVAQAAASALQNALAYRQLREAEQSLQTVDRHKNEFIAVLAHELRNPLAPLRNGLQVIRLAGGDPASVARVRDMMDRQLSHLVRLVDDLLDVSRIARNKLELRRGRVTLADVVGSAAEAAGPVLEAAGHELTVSLPAVPVFLDADPTRLAQVFGNLLINSARYTRPGGRVRVTAELRGGAVAVAVQDNGVGIPAKSLPRIFEMFSQADRSLERGTGGLGIGLALVKGVVELHGGSVAAESEDGKGSTFTVTLPVVAESAAAPTEAPEPAYLPCAPGLRVLVVDDNRDGADSLAEMLRLMGHEVETAGDGLAAVEQAEVFRPELVLMDLGMPRLNGYDATRRIREQPWGTAMTVVALTGWGQECDKERSREAGCDGHLVKPVSPSDLTKLLDDLRTRRPPNPPVRTPVRT